MNIKISMLKNMNNEKFYYVSTMYLHNQLCFFTHAVFDTITELVIAQVTVQDMVYARLLAVCVCDNDHMGGKV